MGPPRIWGVKKAARRTSGKEAGQMLIVFTFLLTSLLLSVGLVIDIGSAIVSDQNAQNASDAAALAAGSILGDGGSEEDAIAVAEALAAANGFNDGVNGVGVTVNVPPASGPFAGDATHAEVIIDDTSSTHFFTAIGIDFVNVQGRAVSVGVPPDDPEVPPALFAIESSCSASDPLEISGSDAVVVAGRVHSNSKIKIGGSNNDFNDGVEYRCDPFDNSGSGNTFNPPVTKVDDIEPSPLNYVFSDFPCTRTFTSDTDLSSVNTVWLNDDPSTNQLKPGVYCSTGKLTLSGQNVTGNVTLVAQQELSISGSDFNLTAYWENVLAFTSSNSSSAMDLSGSGGSWTGYLNAPNGRVKIGGSGNISFHASIVAKHISVSGQDFSIDASALAEAGEEDGGTRLVE